MLLKIPSGFMRSITAKKARKAQSYPVTIRYFDVTEGRVLYTTTVTASYDSQLTVTAPEKLHGRRRELCDAGRAVRFDCS